MDTVPLSSDPRWVKVIQGEVKPKFEFLAAKVLMVRLTMQAKADNSGDNLKKCAEELRQLYVKNINNPMALKDLATIFG